MLTKLPVGTLRVWLYLLVVILFTNSCKKEPGPVSDFDSIPESISEFKKWFTSNSIDQAVRIAGFRNYTGSIGPIKLEPLAGNGAEPGTSSRLSLRPEWDQAITYHKGDSIIAEIPINKRSAIAFSLQALAGRFDFSRSASITRFLFIKTPLKTRATYMTIIATEGYLKGDKSKLAKNTLRKKNKDFSGYVLYHTLGGYFLNGYLYHNGKVVNALTPRIVNKPTGQAARTNFERLQNAVPICETYYITQYYEQCTDWFNGGGTYMYTTCDYWSETSYFDVCTSGSSGSGGGSGDPPPGDNGPDDPCDDGNGGIGMINSDGERVMSIIPGCGDEPTPTAPPNNATIFNANINDANLIPCAQTILADLKQLNTSSISSIIQTFAQSPPGFGWNWEISGGTVTGSKNAYTLWPPQNFIVKTVIDNTYLSTATDLSIARTILHESIHAYLNYYFRYDYACAQLDYGAKLDKFLTAKNGTQANSAQHDIIVQQFIQSIASGLQEYATSKGYTINDPNYFNDMAWGGLQTTTTYNRLSYSNRLRIGNRIEAEKTNTTVDTAIPLGQKNCP